MVWSRCNTNHNQLHLDYSFYNDPPSTETSTLSLHDALPICAHRIARLGDRRRTQGTGLLRRRAASKSARICRRPLSPRSEEHTSELQSPYDLVCRLLLEKKKKHYRLSFRVY